MISANWKNGQGYELILCYEAHTRGGNVCNGQENDAWPDYEPTYCDVTLLSLHRPGSKNLSWDRETVYAQFDPARARGAHLVVVRHRDGDTFGTSHGNVYIEGVYKTRKEADKIAKSIEDDTYEGYKTWSGYFMGMESVEVVSMRIEK